MSTETEYKKMGTRIAGDVAEHDFILNLLVDFVGRIERAGERSPREALECLRSMDRIYQEVLTSCLPYYPSQGLRNYLATVGPHPTTAVLFEGMGWDFNLALHSGTPWMRNKCPSCTPMDCKC